MSGKELLILSIITLSTVISWIVYDVYHAATKSTVTTVQTELMKPLTPSFDHETIIRIVENEP